VDEFEVAGIIALEAAFLLLICTLIERYAGFIGTWGYFVFLLTIVIVAITIKMQKKKGGDLRGEKGRRVSSPFSLL